MNQSSSWKPEDGKGDLRSSGGSGVPNQSTGNGYRQRSGGGYKEYSNRGYDNGGRRTRAGGRHSDFDMFIHQHPMGNGYNRQPTWTGINMPLQSSNSQPSINRDRRSHHPPTLRHRDEISDTGRNSIPLTVGSKLEDKGESNDDGPVTYIAAGTAPVSIFRSGSTQPVKKNSQISFPSFTGPMMTANSRTVSPYPSVIGVEQTDLRHYEQGLTRKTSGSDDLSMASQSLMDHRGSVAVRCKDNGTTYVTKKASDLHKECNVNARQHSSATYFCHQPENERTLLAVFLAALKQQLPHQRQSLNNGGIPRFLSEGEAVNAMEKVAVGKDNTKLEEGNQERTDLLYNTQQAAGLHMFNALYPGIVGRNGAGACSTRSSSTSTPIDEASLLAAQRARGTDMGMPEEMLPILMRLMQQMGVQSPSSGGQSIQIDDSLRQEEKMNQQVQLGTTQPHGMWGTGQSAVKQQLNAQASQKNHTQAYGQPPSQTVVQNSTQEFYSAVVARQSSKLSGDHATKTTLLSRRTQSLQSPNVTGSPPTHATRLSKDQSVRSIPSDLPLSHDIGVMENEAEFGDDMEQISNDLIVLSVSSSRDDIITPCGESGYHSESSPPLPIEQKQRDASPTPVSPVVSCSSKSGEKTNRVPVSPSVCAPSSSKEVSSFAAAATNLSPSLSASLSTPPCPPPSGPVSSTGQFEVSKMDVLSEEIWHYHNSVTQTDTMLNRKLHLRDMLYYSICPVFPMCGLYVVGSSLNGFGNNSSDMDLCLMITNKDLDQKTDAVVVLNMILSTLQQIEWVAHQKLILAKVPILRIKFAAPFADITVDLNANNSVAIKNTHLLCYYSSFDWRVRPLVSVVKEWAKRKGINDANRSSFTSYSLVLMVIHFLQCGAEPSVLPSLQQLYPRRFSSKCDVRALNVTLPLGPPTADEWQFSEKATLGELLIGFLDYYANKFDYDRDAISVRLGKRMDRAIIARQRPNAGYQNNGTNWRSQWRCICIEEPFTYSNTAHSIYDEMVFDAIKSALREAHLELDSTRDLQRLLNCKPISVNAPIGGAMVFATSYEGVRTPSATSLGTATVSNNNVSTRLSIVGSGSASSLSTAHSDASSSASSTSGEEQDHDRLRELPPSPPFKSIPSRSQWRRPNRHGSLTTVSSRQ